MTSALVSVHDRQATTDSLTVARVFEKKHKVVLVAIERLKADLPSRDRHNFKPISYLDQLNRPQTMYQITRDGFSLLAMSFTGKKALQFKLAFIAEFNRMEQALRHRHNLDWQEQRTLGKATRRTETDAISRFIQYAADQGSHCPRHYYANITKMTYQALHLAKEAPPQGIRDTVDAARLNFLAVAEHLVKSGLEDGMDKGLPYKDLFQQVKEQVKAFASTLPLQRRISA